VALVASYVLARETRKVDPMAAADDAQLFF
jgi:hypothetical protein